MPSAATSRSRGSCPPTASRAARAWKTPRASSSAPRTSFRSLTAPSARPAPSPCSSTSTTTGRRSASSRACYGRAASSGSRSRTRSATCRRPHGRSTGCTTAGSATSGITTTRGSSTSAPPPASSTCGRATAPTRSRSRSSSAPCSSRPCATLAREPGGDSSASTGEPSSAATARCNSARSFAGLNREQVEEDPALAAIAPEPAAQARLLLGHVALGVEPLAEAGLELTQPAERGRAVEPIARSAKTIEDVARPRLVPGQELEVHLQQDRGGRVTCQPPFEAGEHRGLHALGVDLEEPDGPAADVLFHVSVEGRDRHLQRTHGPAVRVHRARLANVRNPLRKPERRLPLLRADGGAVQADLREPVETDVLLEHPEVLRHRLERVHLAALPHGPCRDEREDPDVSADVEHGVAGAEKALVEGQLARLVALVEDAPLNV